MSDPDRALADTLLQHLEAAGLLVREEDADLGRVIRELSESPDIQIRTICPVAADSGIGFAYWKVTYFRGWGATRGRDYETVTGDTLGLALQLIVEREATP